MLVEVQHEDAQEVADLVVVAAAELVLRGDAEVLEAAQRDHPVQPDEQPHVDLPQGARAGQEVVEPVEVGQDVRHQQRALPGSRALQSADGEADVGLVNGGLDPDEATARCFPASKKSNT